MAFLIRQLTKQSLGNYLRSLRKRQGIHLEDVSRQTQIQKKYLEAFEEDAHHLLPDPIYARHFLRQFVEAIQGDVDYVLARYEEECGSCSAVTDSLRVPRQRTAQRLLRTWRTWAKIAGIAAVILALVGYISFQIFDLVSPPNLIVDTPHEDIQTTVATLVVSGQTDQEVRVLVNDEPVLTDPTGRFTTQLTLTRGLNVILIEASKKYGQANTVRRTVFLEDLGSNRREPQGSTTSPFVPPPAP